MSPTVKARKAAAAERLLAEVSIIKWLYQGDEEAYINDLLDEGMAHFAKHRYPAAYRSRGWWPYWISCVHELAKETLLLRKSGTLFSYADLHHYWTQGLRSIDTRYFKPLTTAR